MWTKKQDNLSSKQLPVVAALRRGDRVRLVPSFAVVQSYKQRKTTINWLTREGVVVSANAIRVRVLWDGRKHEAEFPSKAIQRVSA